MLKVAVFGYGNLGKAVIDAILVSSDIELCGVIMRTQSVNKHKIPAQVSDDINKLEVKPDVAILCIPTRSILEIAESCLAQGINTVDSYDIHKDIWEIKNRLDQVAKKGKSTAMVSAGFDPGCDSIVRTLFEVMAPIGKTFTNFGPGMSMGHTVAVKAIDGVKNALAMTIPLGTGVHRRLVYVELIDGYDFMEISRKIKEDPYFFNDEIHVYLEKNVDSLIDVGHGVNLVRKGVSGKTHNQLFEFNMKINNPALTAQVMVACARAGVRQKPGAYTMIEIPIIDLINDSKENIIKRLV